LGDPGADRITSIKQDFKETGRKGVGWINRAQSRGPVAGSDK